MSPVPQATTLEALAIVGATASEKTALALPVAERLDGETISMDSRQVYRGLDIATAKATPSTRWPLTPPGRKKGMTGIVRCLLLL
ncbi:MAG: hypothetical protein M3483_04375 [Gemmatimonadota bacterium]|nr:hypothetical protein [Gemmatimonadota bacterium]